jgi:8-oxo-dGTP diphosphatase
MGAKEQGADAVTVQNRWQVVPRTLCFVTNGDDILLMKRGPHKRIFANHYNGVGGHIERDEDPLSSARREIKEETGLEAVNLRYCGSTHIDAGQATGILLFVFVGVAQQREVIDCEEGELQWLSLQDVLADMRLESPARRYVEDLPIILPRIFEADATPFFAHVSYDDADTILFRVAE